MQAFARDLFHVGTRSGRALKALIRPFFAMATLAAMVSPAQARVPQDGSYDVAVVIYPSSVDGGFWQHSYLDTVMSTAPGNAPWSLSSVNYTDLKSSTLALYDVLVVPTHNRYWVTEKPAGSHGNDPTFGSLIQAWVKDGGVFVNAPGKWSGTAGDPLMTPFGPGYELSWEDNYYASGIDFAVPCVRTPSYPSGSDLLLSEPNLLNAPGARTVFEECDRTTLKSAGLGAAWRVLAVSNTKLRKPNAAGQAFVDRNVLAIASYGQGAIIATTGQFTLDTPAHEKLAENMIRYTGKPSDTIAPEVALHALPRATSAAELSVSGSVDDAGGIGAVQVLLNGAVVASPTPDADGSVSASITLAQGANTVTLRATDSAGNLTERSASVLLDITAPIVAVDPAAALTSAPTVVVTGNVADNDGIAGVSILVNGATVASPVPDPEGEVSATVALTEGLNTIEIRAADQVGNSAGAQISVKLDSVRPAVQVLALPEITSQAQLEFSGTAHDPSGLASSAVLLNGVEVNTASPDEGIFTATLSLQEGVNTIELHATDNAGNSAAHQVEVLLDSVAPTLSVKSPNAGQVFGSSSVQVTVDVKDATATTVTINDVATPLPVGGGLVTTDVTLASEGANTLNLSVTDRAGNVVSRTVDVVLDLTAPVVTTELSDGIRLGPQSNDVVLVTLHVDDTTGTTATLGGSTYALPAGGGVVQGAVQLTEGQNQIPISVTDASGLTTQLSRTVVYDKTAPAGSMSVPETGAILRGTIELSATAEDNLTGVAGVGFRIDGGDAILAERDANASGAWLADFDTTPLTDGTHTATVRLADGVGNTRSYQTSFKVDNTLPTVAFSAPSNGAYVSGQTTISVQAADATSSVDSLEITANGMLVRTCEDVATCSAAFDTTQLPSGTLRITATALDNAGNRAKPAQIDVIVDNDAPSKFLVSPASGSIVEDTVDIAVNAASPDFASVECSVDGVSLGVSTDPKFSKTVSVSEQTDGKVVVRCVVTDRAGNTGAEVATVTVDGKDETCSPRQLNLKIKHIGNWMTVHIRGLGVGALLPIASHGFTFVVPGGKPVSVSAGVSSTSLIRNLLTGQNEVTLRFDREEVVQAIKAGISARKINVDKPVPVKILANNREVASDSIRCTN